MSQPLPYAEIKFDTNVKVEKVLITPDDSDIGYLILDNKIFSIRS